MKTGFTVFPLGDRKPMIADPKRVLRRCAAAVLGLAALALTASAAAANDVTATFSCTGVTFFATNFPDSPGNVVNELVYVDGNLVAQPTLTFDGPSGSNTVPLSLSGGELVSAYAQWNVGGDQEHFFNQETISDCGGPPPPPCEDIGTINSNFNGTAVVGAASGPAFIWFNSNLKATGMTAGHSIFLSESKVFINGVGHDVPNAKITFAAVACATTSFDDGTNTWNTTVPLAGSDEIFLSGLAFPTTNLPGGAQVSWTGNFATDQPGACLSWKWGAAAYKFFTTESTSPLVIDYNAANIKPAHSGACGINNGDHAGTPQNGAIRATVTGGARGGGGSNFTGSWSGTGSMCPQCPPTTASALASGAGTATQGVGPGMESAPVYELSFAAPRPNPTANVSTFDFALPRSGPVSLNVYDVSGRLIRGLASGEFSAGMHTLSWDLLDRNGQPVSRGVYFVRLATEGRVLSRTLVVSR
jgi:hypothetical protein